VLCWHTGTYNISLVVIAIENSQDKDLIRLDNGFVFNHLMMQEISVIMTSQKSLLSQMSILQMKVTCIKQGEANLSDDHCILVIRSEARKEKGEEEKIAFTVEMKGANTNKVVFKKACSVSA